MDSVFAERMQNLFIFQSIIREYFRKFAEDLRSIDLAEIEKKIKNRALERDSLWFFHGFRNELEDIINNGVKTLDEKKI